jgi:hypothetical protein
MPVLLNILIGVPQMLSNIQMILICVAVSDKIPARFACHNEKWLTTSLFLADRRPPCAEHVRRAARERLTLPPTAKRAKGALGQWSLTTSGIWFPWYPRVALRHDHVSLPSFSGQVCLLRTFTCAQVVLVPAAQRRAFLLACPQVRKLPRRSHERPTVRGSERVLLYSGSNAVGVRLFFSWSERRKNSSRPVFVRT